MNHINNCEFSEVVTVEKGSNDEVLMRNVVNDYVKRMGAIGGVSGMQLSPGDMVKLDLDIEEKMSSTEGYKSFWTGVDQWFSKAIKFQPDVDNPYNIDGIRNQRWTLAVNSLRDWLSSEKEK